MVSYQRTIGRDRVSTVEVSPEERKPGFGGGAKNNASIREAAETHFAGTALKQLSQRSMRPTRTTTPGRLFGLIYVTAGQSVSLGCDR